MGQKPSGISPIRGVQGSLGRGAEVFSCKVTTGAAGAVASTDTVPQCRLTTLPVKTAATVGRYTFTLPDKYRRLIDVNVLIVGPNTANYGANTTGLGWFLRADDVDANNNDGTFELQFVQASYADAELPDNTVFIVTIWVARGV